jgi:CheY-like chemotaxis protein
MAVVLIAEDDALVRDVAEGMILDSNHQALLAGDVREALHILREPSAIDVLFTDIRLKDEIYGGCDLARHARELRPDIKVLYATGHFEDKLKPLLLPDAPLLLKPYSYDQLSRTLAGLLAG